MRLIGFHIYGYGHFIDFKVDHLCNLQLIYGENEAGKSTIMSFVHSILFGFPLKNQRESIYEPKFHSAYGGSLTFQHNQYGKVFIERVRGKSIGDVTVKLEDGTIGDEELLTSLLRGIDRVTFQNIFSFNLQGLQEVQRLKGEELSRYLLTSGAVGANTINKVEESIQKEADLLFRPQGKKPKLNELLQNLRDAEKEFNHAKKQNDQYASLIQKRNAYIEELKNMKQKSKELFQELYRMKELQEKWSIIQEYQENEQRIHAIGTVRFPVDGLIRYEQYVDKQVTISSRIQGLEEKMAEWTEQIKQYTVPERLEVAIERGETFIQEWPYYLQTTEDIAQYRQKLMDIEKKSQHIQKELHYPNYYREFLSEINLGFDMKGKIRELLQSILTIETKLDHFRSQEKEMRKEISQSEEICNQLEERLLPEQKFKELKEQVNSWKSVEDLQRDREEKVRLLEKEKDSENRNKKSVMLQTILLLFSLGIGIWSFISKEWYIFLFSGFVSLYSLISIWLLFSHQSSTRAEIEKEIEQLTKMIKNTREVNNPVSRYNEQLQIREEWKKQIQALAEKHSRLQELISEQKHLQRELEEKELEIQHIKRELRLDQELSNSRLEDAFELLQELVSLQQDEKDISNLLDQKLAHLTKWQQDMEELAQIFQVPYKEDRELFLTLKSKINEIYDKQRMVREMKKQLAEYEEEKHLLLKEKQTYVDLIEQLFKHAEVENEEEYRLKARRYEELQNLLERQNLIKPQLQPTLMEQAAQFTTLLEVQDKISELEEQIQEMNRLIEEKREKLASIRYNIQVLEEGGTYTEKLHRFYQIKSQFNEEAREWAKLVIAKSLLQRTTEKLVEERFPKMVETVEEYIRFLTDSKYDRIYFQNNEHFQLRRHDGQVMDLVELSQGTKELVYTAFRLGLVHVLKEEYPFPIIIDDGFVNFDRQRTEKIMQLLKTISDHTQILLFSCHDHIRSYFDEKNVYHLWSYVQQ